MPPPTAGVTTPTQPQPKAQDEPVLALQSKYSPKKEQMTDEKHDKLLILRERVDDLLEPVLSNNPILHRFLTARNYDIDQSEAMLRKAMAWRDEFGVSKLNNIGQIHTALKLGIIDTWKHLDRFNRPVLIIQPSRINPKFQGCDIMDLVRVIVYKLEETISRMKEGVETLVVIVDFHDFGMRNVTFDPLREIINILQDYYPERMGALFLVDSPFIFNAVWTIASPWVDASTREKIHFIDAVSELKDIFTADTIPPSRNAVSVKLDAWAKWTADDTLREKREREGIRFAFEDAERRRIEAEEEEEERARIEAEDLEAKMNWRRSQAIALDTLPELPPMEPREKRSKQQGKEEDEDDAGRRGSVSKRRGSGGWRRSLRLVRGSLQRSSLASVSDAKPDASVTEAVGGGEGDASGSRKNSRRQSIIFRWRKAAVDAAAEQGTDLEDQLRAELGLGEGDEKDKDKEKEKKDGGGAGGGEGDGEEKDKDKPKSILRRRTFSGAEAGDSLSEPSEQRPKGILRKSGTFEAPKLDDGKVHPDALLRINTERNRASGMFDATSAVPPDTEEPAKEGQPRSILRKSGTFEPPKLDDSEVHPDALLKINTERNRASGVFDATLPEEENEEKEKEKEKRDGPKSILRRSGTFEPPKIDDGKVHPDALLRINTEKNRASGMFDATTIDLDEKGKDKEEEKPRRRSLKRAASTSSIGLTDEEKSKAKGEFEKSKQEEDRERTAAPRSILRKSGTFEPPKLDDSEVHPDALLKINTERNRASGVFDAVSDVPPEPAKEKEKDKEDKEKEKEKPKGILRRSGTFDSIDVSKPKHSSVTTDGDKKEKEGEGKGKDGEDDGVPERRRSRRLSLRFSASDLVAEKEKEEEEAKKKARQLKQKEDEEKKKKRISSTSIKSADLDRRVIAPVITTQETEFRAPPKLPGKAAKTDTPDKQTKSPADIVASISSAPKERLEEMLSPEWADREEREEREAMDEKRREISERKRESINVLMAAVKRGPIDAQKSAEDLVSELKDDSKDKKDNKDSITLELPGEKHSDGRIGSVEPPVVPRPSIGELSGMDDTSDTMTEDQDQGSTTTEDDGVGVGEWKQKKDEDKQKKRKEKEKEDADEDDKPKHESYQDASMLVTTSIPEEEHEFRAPPRRGSRSGSLRGSLSMPKRMARPSMAFFRGMAPDLSMEEEIRKEAAEAAREAAASAPTAAVVGEGGTKVHDRRSVRGGSMSAGGGMSNEDKRKSGYNLQVAMAQVASEEGVGLTDLERDIKGSMNRRRGGDGDGDDGGSKRRMSRRFSLMFKGAAKRAVEQAREEKAEKSAEEEDPLTSENVSKKKRRASVFDAFKKKKISELVAEAADNARAEEESARAAAHAARVNEDDYNSGQVILEDAGAIKWIPEGYEVEDYDRSWAAQPPEMTLEDALDSEPEVDVGDEDLPSQNILVSALSQSNLHQVQTIDFDSDAVLPRRQRAETRTRGRNEAFEKRDARLREAAVRDIERTLKEKEQRVRLLMRQKVRRKIRENERREAQKQAEDSILGSVVSSLASLVEWSMNADADADEEASRSDSDSDSDSHSEYDATDTDSDVLSEASLDDYDLDLQAERRRNQRSGNGNGKGGSAASKPSSLSRKGDIEPKTVDPTDDVQVAAMVAIPTHFDLAVRGFMSGEEFFYTPKELKEREAARIAAEERARREEREAEERREEERLRREALVRRERLKAEVEKKLMEQHDMVLKRQKLAAEKAEAERLAEAEKKKAEELAEARRARQIALAKQKAAEKKEAESASDGEGDHEGHTLRRRASSLTFGDDEDDEDDADSHGHTDSTHDSDTRSSRIGRSPSPPPKLGIVDWGDEDDEDEDDEEEEEEETPLQRRLRLAAEKRGGSPPPAIRKSGSASTATSTSETDSEDGTDSDDDSSEYETDSEEESETDASEAPEADSDDSDDEYSSLAFNPSHRHIDD